MQTTIVVGATSGLGSYLYNSLGPLLTCGTTRKILDGLTILDPCREESVYNFVNSFSHDASINLVHCVGLSINSRTSKMGLESWEDVIKVNLTSAFLLSKHFLPMMRRNRYGRIIFCGSVVPRIGVGGTPAYSASKSALLGLARTICEENAVAGITCNVLELGYFNAGMGRSIPEAVKADALAKIPAGRFGDPEEFCTAVKFLIECPYVNGSLISVAGGL